MKKIAWITVDSFIEVDMPVMKSLDEEDEIYIDWYIIFFRNRANNFSCEGILNEVKKHFVSVDFIFFKKRMRSLISFFQVIRLILKIRNSAPDIVYINGAIEPYLAIVVRFFFNKRKVIIAVHDVKPHVGVGRIFQVLMNIRISLFQNFHLFSENQRRLFDARYNFKTLFVIPLFLQNFGHSNKIKSTSKINFLFFGTIRYNKGLENLILAGNELAKLYKGKFDITIAGQCDNWEDYNKLILDKSVFNLFIYPINNEDVADYFCQAHYLVLPYRDVTQSGPLMLAFNYGVVPIASNHEGFKEHIIDNETGYVLSSNNYLALYQTMSEIIEKHNSNYPLIKHNLDNYVSNIYKIDWFKNEYLKMFRNLKGN